LLASAALLSLIQWAYPATARAQDALVFATGGPSAVWNIGLRDMAWQLGAGGEVLTGNIGWGGELAYVYFPAVTRSFEGRTIASHPAASALSISATAAYHFDGAAGGRRTRPFVIGGAAAMIGDELTRVLLHLAGGVDVWTMRRTGLRFEVLGQFPSMLGVRAGIVFR
jgi:hypothetical protein